MSGSTLDDTVLLLTIHGSVAPGDKDPTAVAELT